MMRIDSPNGAPSSRRRSRSAGSRVRRRPVWASAGARSFVAATASARRPRRRLRGGQTTVVVARSVSPRGRRRRRCRAPRSGSRSPRHGTRRIPSRRSGSCGRDRGRAARRRARLRALPRDRLGPADRVRALGLLPRAELVLPRRRHRGAARGRPPSGRLRGSIRAGDGGDRARHRLRRRGRNDTRRRRPATGAPTWASRTSSAACDWMRNSTRMPSHPMRARTTSTMNASGVRTTTLRRPPIAELDDAHAVTIVASEKPTAPRISSP